MNLINASKGAAVVTGGSEGIGLAIVDMLIERGHSKVYMVARNPGKLEAAKETLVAKHGNLDDRLETFSADVTDFEKIETELMPKIEKEPSLLWVNNAGTMDLVEEGDKLVDIGRKTQRAYSVNVSAPMALTKYLIEHFRTTDKELYVVHMLSQAALQAFPGNMPYGPGKKGYLIGTIELLEQSVPKGANIHFAYVYPGTVRTPGTADKIASGAFQNPLESPKAVTSELKLILDGVAPANHVRVNQGEEGKHVANVEYFTVPVGDMHLGSSLGEDHKTVEREYEI